MKIQLSKKRQNIYLMVLLVGLAILFSLHSALQMRRDTDEYPYMKAACAYYHCFSQQDISCAVNYIDNQEHAAFSKVIYSLAGLFAKVDWQSEQFMVAARIISATFAIVLIIMLGLHDIIAGFLLIFFSLFIKYTSEVYLEAPPMLFSFLAILALFKAKHKKSWFYVSAVFFGMSLACKYPYLAAGPALLLIMAKQLKVTWKKIFLYFGLALFVFYAFDITLWYDPVGRLIDSYGAYQAFANTVAPEYQNSVLDIVWIMVSAPGKYVWDTNKVFFWPVFDAVIVWLALVGFVRNIWLKKLTWPMIWLVCGVLIISVSMTRWAHHTCILLVPMAVLASDALRNFARFCHEKYFRHA